MLLGVEVRCGAWGPTVMLPMHRAVPALPENTSPEDPLLSHKEKSFWLHLAKSLHLVKKKKKKEKKKVANP